MRPYFDLAIPNSIRAELLAHAGSERPLECCGILAGVVEEDRGIVKGHFPIRNDLQSPTEYLTDARDLLDAMKAMRAAGWEPLAIYHSHPASEPIPSRTDLERNTWGETVAHVIIGGHAIRGWWLGEDGFEEIQIGNTDSR